MSYSNPEKKVQTSISFENIVSAIKLIPQCLGNVKIDKATNEDFQFYVLDVAGSGLNLGAILEIAVLREGQFTNINFLCRRKIDYIDNRLEYDHCQDVIRDCMSLISRAVKGELKKTNP